MLSFSQHNMLKQMKEKSLGIKREDMPQVFSKNMEDFKKFLLDNNISYFENLIHPKHLKPSQNELNTDKIESLIKSPTNKTIITSTDKYVVDGHHRWAASLLDGSPYLECIEINLPIKELLDKMHTYDNVDYKTVKEHDETL